MEVNVHASCYGSVDMSAHTFVRLYNNPGSPFCNACFEIIHVNDIANHGYYHCVKCHASSYHRNCYEASPHHKPAPHEDCSICMESMNDPSKTTIVTACGHLFHEACLAQVQDNRCPLCRRAITTVARVELYGQKKYVRRKRRSKRSKRTRRSKRSQKR